MEAVLWYVSLVRKISKFKRSLYSCIIHLSIYFSCRDLLESVQNLKCLLNFYPNMKISVCGNNMSQFYLKLHIWFLLCFIFATSVNIILNGLWNFVLILQKKRQDIYFCFVILFLSYNDSNFGNLWKNFEFSFEFERVYVMLALLVLQYWRERNIERACGESYCMQNSLDRNNWYCISFLW